MQFTFKDNRYSQIEWHIPTPSSALVPGNIATIAYPLSISKVLNSNNLKTLQNVCRIEGGE